MLVTLFFICICCCSVISQDINATNRYSPGEPIDISDQMALNQKKYLLITSFLANWFGAVRHCDKIGGRLAKIENEDQQKEIEQLVESSNAQHEFFWVHGTDLAEEGKWTWGLTGPEMGSYRKWHAGQPDNQLIDEHCLGVVKWGSAGLHWNDDHCWRPFHFICEQDIPCTGCVLWKYNNV